MKGINKLYRINSETFRAIKGRQACFGCYFFDNPNGVLCYIEPYDSILGECGKLIFKKIDNGKINKVNNS